MNLILYYAVFGNLVIAVIEGLKVEERFETPLTRASFVSNRKVNTKLTNNQLQFPTIRYRETVETEFYRPGYFPVPYVIGGKIKNGSIGDLNTLPIPKVNLTSLLRHHISPKRDKLAAEHGQPHNFHFPNTILKGVSKITELRQTPYRRFPDNNQSKNLISYVEKRRRWKAELKRRLRGPKVPARSVENGKVHSKLDTIVLSNFNNQILTPNQSSDHYYVTYSPHSLIYQVSRLPPSNSIEADNGESQTLNFGQSNHATASLENSIEIVETNTIRSPTQNFTIKTNDLSPFVNLDYEYDNETSDNEMFNQTTEAPLPRNYLNKPFPEKFMTTTQASPKIFNKQVTSQRTNIATIMKTSTLSPVLLVQKTEPITLNLTFNERIHVGSKNNLFNHSNYPIVKQILHLDDYDMEMSDDKDLTIENEETSEDKSNSDVKPGKNETTDKVNYEIFRNEIDDSGRHYLSNVSRNMNLEDDFKDTSKTNLKIIPKIENTLGVDEQTFRLSTTAPLLIPTTKSSFNNYDYNREVEDGGQESKNEDNENDEDDEDDLFFWKSDFENRQARPKQFRQSSTQKRSLDSLLLVETNDTNPFKL